MKLKLIEHRRIEKAAPVPADPDAPLPGSSGLSLDEKRENLYRAIERAQAFLHKREDPGERMAQVRRLYPAPRYFLESTRKAMTRAGFCDLDAFYYAMIPALTRTSLSQRWGVNPTLDTLERMSRYLRTLYIGVHEEQFYLMLLNRQGRLIRAALLQKGAADSAPFYLGQLLSTALTEGAKFIVLAHNHPRGTLKPSKEDIYCTLRTLNAVAPLKMPLLDHVIVVRSGTVSIRQSGRIPDILWTAPGQGSRIVQGWLDAEALPDYAQ